MRSHRLIARALVSAGAVATAFVLPAPSGAETTRQVPEDFATIAEAIDASEPGDIILVGPGTYRESLLLTEAKGDRLSIRSTAGSAKTTIAYGDTANVNEAVVTFQRCSNSTQLIGFAIDGRGAARRGILANSDSKPLLDDLAISGCEYAIASHKGSSPYLRNVRTTGSRTAGLFISGGAADVKDCNFSNGDKFGIYLSTGSATVRVRNVVCSDNGQVGIQSTDSDLSIEVATILNNGDSGIILQDSSPSISDATVAGHKNVGIVMEVSSATLVNSTIRDNEYGVVSSIEGEPRIFRCMFENNKSYHLGIEGDANPLVGGSIENANRFLGKNEARVQMSSTARVNATYNFWDLPCAPKKFFLNTGTGKIKRTPWMGPYLTRVFDDCREARKYFKLWKKGKLDEEGNPIQKGAAPATAAAGVPGTGTGAKPPDSGGQDEAADPRG